MVRPSRRLDEIPPYLFAQISQIKRQALADGVDVIDLGIGDPDMPTPAPIVEALRRAAGEPKTHRYDETPRGWRPFLDSAADWMRRTFGVNLDPDTEICQLIGSKEGLAHLAWAYADPGDVVLVPSPGYPVYQTMSRMAGAETFSLPLRQENGWLPRVEDVPAETARRAKLLYLCYPNNPTGAVANLAFYEEVVRFCREFDVLLASDMAYAAVTFDDRPSPSVLQVPGGKDVAIEFHSLSKTFNMTGWRLGFACGSPEAVRTLQSLKDNLDSKQFPAIAEAGAFALSNVDNRPIVETYRKRRDVLCDGLEQIGWPVEKPKASFYVWSRVPRPDLSSAEFAAELLRRTGVVVIPGSGYGPEGEGYVRMSLTLLGDVDGARFAEAVERVRDSGLLHS